MRVSDRTNLASGVDSPLSSLLTRGYIIALTVLAAAILAGATVLHGAISNNYSDTETINIAGAQRMLSQRLVGLSERLVSDPGRADADDIRAALAETHARMQSGRIYLLNERREQEASNRWNAELATEFAPQGGGDLERRVQLFLSRFEPILAGGVVSKSEQQALSEEAYGPLLKDLDLAVQYYEAAVKARIVDAERLHAVLVAFSIVLLLAEAFFIFRPLARRASGQVAFAKTALKQRSELLSQSLSVARMGYWYIEFDRPNEMWISQEIADLYGLGEQGGKWVPISLIAAFIPEHDNTHSLPGAVIACRKTRQTQRLKTTLTLASGRKLCVFSLFFPRYDSEGAVIGVSSVVRDISEEETQKRDLEMRSNQLVEAQLLGKTAMWRQEVGTDVFELSDEYYRLLGYEPGAFEPTFQGFQTIQVDAAASSARMFEARDKLFKTGQPQTVDLSVRRADGTIAEVLIRQKVERREKGEIVSRFGTIQDITERRNAERQLEQLAYFDHLTGLGNRAMFARKLKAAADASERTEGVSALMLIDLDNFKDVNDGLGHDAGDEFLCEVAQRLTRVAGLTAFPARLGGDEFAILLAGVNSRAEISAIAQELVATLAMPAHLNSGEVVGGASVGVCVMPEDTNDPDEAMRFADLALYHAKDGGRSCAIFFAPSMSEVMVERLSLARNLRGAVERGELSSHFQPIVSAGSMDVIGFEALLRWHCPERGMVPPSQFIPVAESSHIISTLGEFVFMDACATLRAWMDAGIEPREISINVSAAQLWNSDLEMMIDRALQETGVPPEYICVELTESVFVGDALSRVEGLLTRLKARGLRLALDDFGTGYSSLGYLNRLPFDKLKVDRCFVSGVDLSTEKQELLAGIVGLARGLGMKTVAEGVETEGELNVVRALECDHIQGFYFGRPKPAKDAILGAADIKVAHQLRPLTPKPAPRERRAVRR